LGLSSELLRDSMLVTSYSDAMHSCQHCATCLVIKQDKDEQDNHSQ